MCRARYKEFVKKELLDDKYQDRKYQNKFKLEEDLFIASRNETYIKKEAIGDVIDRVSVFKQHQFNFIKENDWNNDKRSLANEEYCKMKVETYPDQIIDNLMEKEMLIDQKLLQFFD